MKKGHTEAGRVDEGVDLMFGHLWATFIQSI